MSSLGSRLLGEIGSVTGKRALLCLGALAAGCTTATQFQPSVPAAALMNRYPSGGAAEQRDFNARHGKAVSRSTRAHRSAVAPLGRNALQVASDEDYVVRIVAPSTSCSGTLISEQLVLTAHHCVALRDGAGRVLPADLAPQRLTVELGSGHFPWAEVQVKAIIAPSCGFAAGAGDVAVLVLSRRMRGVPTLAPALDREPKLGDEVAHIGFGRCALSEDGIYLKRRASGVVDLISKTGFRVNAPLCPGDSGGPVIDVKTGALAGVVSAGAMDGDEKTPDRVEFSRLDPFRGLFANAERVAAGTAMSELPPVDCPAPVVEEPKVKSGRNQSR